MSERDDRRRPLLWTAALLLMAVAAWLLVPPNDDDESAADLGSGDIEGETRTVDLLQAEGETEAPPAAAGPALVGRAEDPADLPKRGPVCVTVLGAGDHPLVGVVVEAVPTTPVDTRKEPASPKADTDEEGVAVFGDLPYDGSQTVRLRRTQGPTTIGYAGNVVILGRLFQKGRPQATAEAKPVLGPEVLLRTETGLPLRVDVVSADSGRHVPGTRWTAKPDFKLRPLTDWAALRHGPPLAVKHGEDVAVEIEVDPIPDDYRLHDAAKWKVRVHPAARRLVAKMPLRPEARVFVTFDEPEGVPPGTTYKPGCMLGTCRLKNLGADPDAYGRWRLRRVPHIPGERIRIRGTYGDWGLSAKGRLPLDADEPLHLHAKLNPIHRTTVSGRFEVVTPVVFGGTFVTGRDGTLLIASEGTIKLAITSFINQRFKLELEAGKRPPPTPPRFDVLVKGADGQPVAGAQVTISNQAEPKQKPGTQSTSKKGVARFEGLAPGTYDLLVWGAGAPFRQTVVVPEGGRGNVTVRGGAGAEVHLFVVGEDGEPMPFATLAVEQPSKLPWCDVVDGVQLIDPFTDRLGRRILHNVEAGEVKITARLGWRVGSATVKVPRGGSTHAQIVIAWPPPPPAKKKPAK